MLTRKILILVLSALFMGIPAQGLAEVKKEYYPNGVLKAERTYRDNKLNGITRIYYDNGRFKFEWNFKDGKRDGISKLYFKGGILAEGLGESTLMQEVIFKKGQRDGTSKRYYENGELREEANFKNGKPHGITRMYRENGEVYEWNYKDGKMVNRKQYRKKEELATDQGSQNTEPR